MRAADRDPEELAREDVGCAVEAAHVRVARGAQRTVWALRAAQSKLQKLLRWPNCDAVTRRVRCHERRVVAQREDGGLDYLAHRKRPFDAHARHARKSNRALAHCGDLQPRAVH